jgi:hypothetical protein
VLNEVRYGNVYKAVTGYGMVYLLTAGNGMGGKGRSLIRQVCGGKGGKFWLL